MYGRRQQHRPSKKSKQEANELFLRLEQDVANYQGNCLFVNDEEGGYCDKPVSNNCHIVSESAILDKLKDDKTKKVLELQWGVSQWRELLFMICPEQLAQDPTTFNPSERTTRDACTGWFACNPTQAPPQVPRHDNEFWPTDVAEPDFDDPEVRFLSVYRLMLFVADQYRQSLWLLSRWEQRAMRSPIRRGPAVWLREKKKRKKGLRRAESTVKLLGAHWHARKTGGTFDLDVVSAKVLKFRSKLRLSGGVSYGKATGVTLFPLQGDWHKMAVLYLTSESDAAREDIERLAGVARASEESDNYGVAVTNELMTKEWGVLAMSPKSYEGLNDQDQFTIQSLVASHSRDVVPVRSTYRPSPRWQRRRK